MHMTARSLLRCVIAGVVAPAILTSLTYPQVIRLNADTTGSQNETTISLNLQNPANLVAGSNYIGQWVAAYSTFNAGATWSETLLPKGSYDRAVDPSVAFDRLGNAWFAHLCLDLLPENHPANGIFVNRSTDGGVTWLAQPYVVTENGDPEGSEGTTIRDDRPGIACDRVPNSPFVNSVYVVWTQGSSDSSDNQIYFSWHDQELLEFSTPVKISDSPTGLAQAPAVAVGAGGRVLVAWYDRDAQEILLDVSTDGGRTFGVDTALASNVVDGVVVRGARAPTYPSMATDALGGRYNGNIYITWHEKRSSYNRVMFRRSINNGDSWEEAFPLEEDPTFHRWFPWVTTAPNGVVHVVYYSQTPSGVLVRLGTSYQGGVVGQFEHSSASEGPIVYGGSGSPPFMGDYIGVAAGLDNVYPTWCATVNGQEDVFARRIIQPSYNVVLEQKDEVGTPLGQLRHWDGFDFGQPFSSGTTSRFRIYTEEVVRADTSLLGQNKYNDWENEPNILNHHRFEVNDSSLSTYTARLKNAHNASVITGVIDGPATGGSIWFTDPWYRDTSDVLGVLNRGIGAVSRSVLSATYNVGLTSAYRGVFLNAVPDSNDPSKPFYSVGAPDSQSVAGLPGYFQRWSGNGASFRDPLAAETPVVFAAPGATATALYKAHLRSGSYSALHSNSQRKVIRDSVGCYHMVYESAGHIWHVRSTDDGATWSRERRLSQEGSIPVTYSSASLTVLPESRRVAAVWEWRDASTTCVQLALLDDRTGEPVSICDVAIYEFAQSAGTMPVVAVARYESSPYLLVAWYDASSESVRGRVVDPEGNLGSETELLAHPVSLISLTPTAEDDRWGLASSDGSTVRWRVFHAPDARPWPNGGEETVAWGSEDLQQRYPSVSFGEGPWINPGVAWEEYAWELDRRVVKYRERRGGSWQPVVVFTDNTNHPDYHSPSMTANWDTPTVGIAWRSGAEELRYVSSGLQGWSAQTVLLVTGSDPALSLGRQPTSGDRELLAYRGISQLYAISTTPVQPLGSGDEESPTAGGEEYQREGRGVSVVFPLGSLRLALVDAAFNGRRVGFGRFPDTVEIRTAEQVETTLLSEPLSGTGELECTLLSQTTGDVPAAGEIRLVLRDEGTVRAILRSFRAGADSVHRIRIPLSLGTKLQRIGVQFWGLGTARIVEPERWMVRESGANANLAQKALLPPEETPAEFRLHPSYPNPFNPSTEIRYELPEPARVSLMVYDVLGRVVATVLDEEIEAGYHTARWNAADKSSGVYLAWFTATTATGTVALRRTMKLVLTK